MIKDRLEALRAKMQEANVDAYFINNTDYHMSEYIPEFFKTIRYFSGFTGSMAQFIVTLDNAYIFVDGRYHTQAETQTSPNGVVVMKLGKEGVPSASQFLKENFKNKKIAIDGRITNTAFVKDLINSGLNIEDLDLYSDLYENRPLLSKDPLFELDVKYTGLTRKEKMDIVAKVLEDKTQVVTNLESIAYMMNIRGNDVENTPVFLSFLVIHDGEYHLFSNLERFSDLILDGLYDDGVILRPYDEFYSFLETIKHKTVLLDENKVNYSAYKSLHKSNNIINMTSIIEDMKSVKNSVEIKNSKMAHILDGVAMLRTMKWLKEVDKEGLTEFDVKVKTDRNRLEYKAFDLSFDTIVGYNENAAMMHYSPTKEINKALHNSGTILIDSGGQYFEGTTDITRTFALGEVDDEVKMWFTIVLKSMFNLANVKFIEGLNGYELDILARKDIWARGVDYRCGTGHGVGHVLSVHEMPPNIRYQKSANPNGANVALKPGHIFSDEPGVYFEGKFGIRSENLLLCKKDEKTEYGQFLSFEHLTMVPFDLDLIDINYLDEETRKSLNDYHELVYKTLVPYLNDEEIAFLRHATRKI